MASCPSLKMSAQTSSGVAHLPLHRVAAAVQLRVHVLDDDRRPAPRLARPARRLYLGAPAPGPLRGARHHLATLADGAACSRRSWSPTAARSRCASSARRTSWAWRPSPSSRRRTGSRRTSSRRTRPTSSAPTVGAELPRGDVLIDVARRSGAEAIHPGYGFLSERAPFIRAVREAGLTFIGPSAGGGDAMGDKTAARKRVIDAGVPVVPGTKNALADAAEARQVAAEVGYPVLLKAAAGGGGKGMRVVRRRARSSAPCSPRATRRRPRSATRGLHREVPGRAAPHRDPAAGDRHGNTLHLGERECSIQRRHQKLVEEAPSAGAHARGARGHGRARRSPRRARGLRGRGHGGVPLPGRGVLLPGDEHPHPGGAPGHGAGDGHRPGAVADPDRRGRGAPLPRRTTCASPATPSSAASPPRIPPTASCRPPGGSSTWTCRPGPGVRWDGGIAAGYEVGLFYDPMLAKLIVHAPTRERGVERMKRALHELRVVGWTRASPSTCG
jgi:hypothetical protein